MAKAFTRCAKEITIAVKAGGPSPDSNPALRRVLQNARAVLDLIDQGLEEMGEGQGEKGEKLVIIRTGFADFGRLQAALEARKIAIISSESEYVPQNVTDLPAAAAKEVLEFVDALEQDDDVQKVYHTLA